MSLIPLCPLAEFWRGRKVFFFNTCKLASLLFDVRSLSGMGLLQTLKLASTLDTVTECIRLFFFYILFFFIFLHRSVSGSPPRLPPKIIISQEETLPLSKSISSPLRCGQCTEWEADTGQAIISVTGWLLCTSLSSACDVTASCSVAHRLSLHSLSWAYSVFLLSIQKYNYIYIIIIFCM